MSKHVLAKGTRRRQSPTVSVSRFGFFVDGTFLGRAFLRRLQIARRKQQDAGAVEAFRRSALSLSAAAGTSWQIPVPLRSHATAASGRGRQDREKQSGHPDRRRYR